MDSADAGPGEEGASHDAAETAAGDVTLDLMAIQSNTLEALRDYGHYLRHAENAGLLEVAYFVRHLIEAGPAR